MKLNKFIFPCLFLANSINAQGRWHTDIINDSKAVEDKGKKQALEFLSTLQKNPKLSQSVFSDSACRVQKENIKNTRGQRCPATSKEQDTINFPQVSEDTFVPKAELLVFISFSLGDSSLKKLYKDVQIIGGRLIIRGLYKNSFGLTQKKVQSLRISVDIDPTLFERFKVTDAPTFILTEPYQENDAYSYDALKGNVTLAFALERFSVEGQVKEAKILHKRLLAGANV